MIVYYVPIDASLPVCSWAQSSIMVAETDSVLSSPTQQHPITTGSRDRLQ